VRIGDYEAAFNLPGNDGKATEALDPGWKAAGSTSAPGLGSSTLGSKPQGRSDISMNRYPEHTWTLVWALAKPNARCA
jgi:hypothetical protein